MEEPELFVCEEEGRLVVVGVEGPVGEGGGAGKPHRQHDHFPQVHRQASSRPGVGPHHP